MKTLINNLKKEDDFTGGYMKKIKLCYNKYEQYSKKFIDPNLEINDIDKFELFIVFKDFMEAIRIDLEIK